jgi:hypothetical protein
LLEQDLIIKPMIKDNFTFFVPVELEKATTNPNDSNRYKNMILRGVASTSDVDADNEVLEPSGFDLSILRTKGTINYEHLAKQSALNIIGEPIEAEIRDNKFILKAKLWEKSIKARDLWDTLHIMRDSGSTRKLGWSIEGKPIARDPRNPSRILKALITNVAVTFAPKNGQTYADICKGQLAPKELDYDIPTDVDYLFKGMYGNHEYTLNKDFTITKAMCAGSTTGQALIGQDTSGAALKKEHLDEDLKILTIPISTIKWSADNWESFQEDTKKALQKALHDQLEKGGEGSRGGRVIGQTKSGKNIYAKHYNPQQLEGWDKEDHADASKRHQEESERYKKMGSAGYDSYQHHARMAIYHKEKSEQK